MEKTMEKIVALAKARGFVYPGSEIYGGLANTWDYGNLGVELKNNVKKAWWQKFIQESPYNVGVDCAILMNPQTWVASGHLGGFSDPLMDCKDCHERFRADKLIEDWADEIHNTLKEIMPEVKTADERVESFLSGGVDSSYVLAMSDAEQADGCGYEEERFDESVLAEKTAQLLGRKFSRSIITPEQFFDDPKTDRAKQFLNSFHYETVKK